MNKVGIIIEVPRIGGPHKQLIYFLNSLKKKNLADLKLYLFLPKSFHGVKQKHNIKCSCCAQLQNWGESHNCPERIFAPPRFSKKSTLFVQNTSDQNVWLNFPEQEK